MALANPGTTQPAGVEARVWDEQWQELAVYSLNLPEGGHSAFPLTQIAAAVSGRRGFVEFQCRDGGKVLELALQFDANGGFNVIPKLLTVRAPE